MVLQLARTITLPDQPFVGAWVGLLTLISIALGTAISAGGTAFSALVVDLTSERERPRVLAVVWGMRLLGVLLGSAFVSRLFGAACEAGASGDALRTGLEQLIVVSPLLLFGLVVFSVVGLEHRVIERVSGTQYGMADVANDPQKNVPLLQLLGRLRAIPQFGRFVGVLCLFTFSMFLNDAVLETYGAAVFGMTICATTALNAFLALGFFCWTWPEWIPARRENGQYPHGSDRCRSWDYGVSSDVAIGAMAVVGLLQAWCNAFWHIAWHLYSCQLYLDV